MPSESATPRPHPVYQLIQELYVLLDDYDRHVLSGFGLNASQYRLLMLLDRDEPQRLTTLSERLLLSKSTVSRSIDQLESVGWVQRAVDPADRRAQHVVLTRLGVERRKAIASAHREGLEAVAGVLAAREQEQLQRLLNRLRSALVVCQHDEGA